MDRCSALLIIGLKIQKTGLPVPRPDSTAQCPVCHSPHSTKSFDAVEPGFSVWSCESCGLRRTSPAVPASEIARYYPQTYYGKENVRFNALFEKMTRYFQARRAAVIDKRVARGPVLDVGCGRGFLLKFLAEQGYDPYGIELSEHAAWHAQHRLGLNVVTQSLGEDAFPGLRFNAMVFWHSLEHFAAPAEAIAFTRHALKPGGLLAVAVPNSDSLQARVFGRHWFHLDVPRHYFHFGTRSLQTLLEKNGFRVVKTAHFSLEQNPFGWVQSFYNGLGFSHNLLYELLKSESARTKRAAELPIQTLLIFITLPVVLLLGFAMTILETMLRRGGTIELYAVRDQGSDLP